MDRRPRVASGARAGGLPGHYTATERLHLLDTVRELAIGTGVSDALRLGGEFAGGPVLEAGRTRPQPRRCAATHSSGGERDRGRQGGGGRGGAEASAHAPGVVERADTSRELSAFTGAPADGAAGFDRRPVVLAREMPGFGGLMVAWPVEDPKRWATVIGPGAGKSLMSLGTPIPMRVKSHRHGSLRPA